MPRGIRHAHGVGNPVSGKPGGRTERRNGSLPWGMKTINFARSAGEGRPAFALLVACGAIGLFAGCASEPSSVLVSAPPPPPPSSTQATVYSTPAPTVYSTPAPTVYSTPAPVTQPVPVATTQTVTTVPSPTGASSIIVMQAPPAAQQEIPSPRPTRDHVWVAGYWTWRDNQYQWMAGHWEVPPRAAAVWVPPRWQPEGTSWRFYEGYWE